MPDPVFEYLHSGFLNKLANEEFGMNYYDLPLDKQVVIYEMAMENYDDARAYFGY